MTEIECCHYRALPVANLSWYYQSFKASADSDCDGRGVEHSVSSSEIKKAYHKAALRHHPDKVVWLVSSLC